MRAVRAHPGAALIVAVFVVLGTLYSVVTPLFETPDELWHYPMAQHIAATGQLPVAQPGVETLWMQEATQPPLYYAIGAALTFWIDTRDLPDVRRLNPHAKFGIPLDPDNRNVVVHGEGEAFPWRGTALAMHLLRLLGVALGAGTVVLAYALAGLVWPRAPAFAWLATALVAFNPMFLFISGAVNNDNLATLLSMWALWLCALVVRDGLTGRRAAALALAVALAGLTKLSGLALAPLAVAALLYDGWRARRWRRMAYALGALALAWLLLAGWWYARNWQLYGDPTALGVHLDIMGRRSPDALELLGEWPGFWISFWALFGWMNVLAEGWVYVVYGLLHALALIGLGAWLVRAGVRRAWPALVLPGLLVLYALIVFASVVRWTTLTTASQGRLMFPALGALGVLCAVGLLDPWPERFRRPLAVGATAGLALIAAVLPFRAIAPAYPLPPVVNNVPPGATPVGVFFDGIELVAVETGQGVIEPGGLVPVTLYWRAARVPDQDYSVSLNLSAGQYRKFGKIDSYPGNGELLATRLPVGKLVQDRYMIRAGDESDLTALLVRVQIGMGVYHPGKAEAYVPLQAQAADGTPVDDPILIAGVFRSNACVATQPPQAQFGDFARVSDPLLGRRTLISRPGATVPVDLIWEPIAHTNVDWTVFVHLVDEHGQPGPQADGPPLGGDYPSSYWINDCSFSDEHVIEMPPDLAPGRYTVLIGLYNAADPALSRAPAWRPDGTRFPDDAAPLGTIDVQAP
jgi:4-amino-4-deoxy-L-arabinose transferase-like glycosyltransferase